MLSMHDASSSALLNLTWPGLALRQEVDSHAAMTGVDAMHLPHPQRSLAEAQRVDYGFLVQLLKATRLLRSCDLSPEATGNIVSSFFEEAGEMDVMTSWGKRLERSWKVQNGSQRPRNLKGWRWQKNAVSKKVEKVRHSSVRQLVLSCVKAGQLNQRVQVLFRNCLFQIKMFSAGSTSKIDWRSILSVRLHYFLLWADSLRIHSKTTTGLPWIPDFPWKGVGHAPLRNSVSSLWPCHFLHERPAKHRWQLYNLHLPSNTLIILHHALSS